MNAATFFDAEEWRDGVLDVVDGRMRLRDEPPGRDLPRFDGVITGGFTDHHVHLQLVDPALLAGSRLGRVIDLGGEPSVVAQLAAEHAVTIEFAGAFLTAPGGYPSDRPWAPAGSFREITSSAEALAAVAQMTDAGASWIKVAGNSAAGPVLDDDLFRAVVKAASLRGLPVVAHAEGPGQARRVAALGARWLAHAPFTERLTDDEIATQAAGVSWISTLAIHDGETRATAIDNVRRFSDAGGTVLYGTDMGNGPTPVDLNPREVDALREAGIDGADLLRALAPQDALAPSSVLLTLPAQDADPILARPLTAADLKV